MVTTSPNLREPLATDMVILTNTLKKEVLMLQIVGILGRFFQTDGELFIYAKKSREKCRENDESHMYQ